MATANDGTPILSQDDDDFLSGPMPDFDKMAEELENGDEAESEETSEGTDQEQEQDLPEETEDDEMESTEEELEEEDDSTITGSEGADLFDSSTDGTDATASESTTTEDSESDDSADSSDGSTDDGSLDSDTELAKLFGGFKANGEQIKVDTVDEAIQLMQMGANYQKKMASIAPNMKYLKMLQNHSLLDEDKLSKLIGLHNRDPDAIKDLLKDNKVDLDTIDLEESTAPYKPETYKVSDAEVQLDAVLADLATHTSFQATLDIVNNNLDSESQNILANNPEALRVLVDHVDNGIYAQVSAVVSKEKMLGRMTGVSDIEAYRQVSDALREAGQLVAPTDVVNSQVNKPDPAKNKSSTASAKRSKQRKAATNTTKRKKPRTKQKEFDILAMSDDDFAKLGG